MILPNVEVALVSCVAGSVVVDEAIVEAILKY